MNSISQLSMNLGGVLLNVLAIIGIIIAGGFLIFFLGDLVLSILDPKNNSLKDKEKHNAYHHEQERLQQPVRPQELTYIPTQQVYEQPKQPVYQEVDLTKALEEERGLFGNEQRRTDSFEKITENSTTRDIFEALKKEEEAYKAEKINSQPTQVFKNKEEEEEDDEFNFDELFFKNVKSEEPKVEEEPELEPDFDFDFNFDDDEEEIEEIEEVEEIEEIEETEEVEEEPAVDNDTLKKLQEENEDLRKEIETLTAIKTQKSQELEEERKALEVLKSQKATEGPLLTVEQYEERLEELKERLKYNEKELRAIKREFIPLRKVRTTLEKDKKKLRRKEALVAKQKILLYGVNNMSDIDEEKAKKLEEDLDLLDGLRLSVQHCEEVIKNSEERYPVLETSFNILTKTISQIKGDIEKVETSLANLKK